MPYALTIRSHLDSAHYLRGYEGKCQYPHGHRFDYEVTFEGDKLDELGILIDFAVVKKQLKDSIESRLDHRMLNDTIPFFEINPTAENIAEYIYRMIKDAYSTVTLKQVTVWESPECSATYWEE